jgi:hypothetical protein
MIDSLFGGWMTTGTERKAAPTVSTSGGMGSDNRDRCLSGGKAIQSYPHPAPDSNIKDTASTLANQAFCGAIAPSDSGPHLGQFSCLYRVRLGNLRPSKCFPLCSNPTSAGVTRSTRRPRPKAKTWHRKNLNNSSVVGSAHCRSWIMPVRGPPSGKPNRAS